MGTLVGNEVIGAADTEFTLSLIFNANARVDSKEVALSDAFAAVAKVVESVALAFAALMRITNATYHVVAKSCRACAGGVVVTVKSRIELAETFIADAIPILSASPCWVSNSSLATVSTTATVTLPAPVGAVVGGSV